jgi:hypothetical protein
LWAFGVLAMARSFSCLPPEVPSIAETVYG